jgi:hypothetical protein
MANQKTGLPISQVTRYDLPLPGNPAVLNDARPVAFRPCLTTGLALTVTATRDRPEADTWFMLAAYFLSRKKINFVSIYSCSDAGQIPSDLNDQCGQAAVLGFRF